MPADETARRELHLPDPGDRERDRAVDLLLAGLRDADAQDASPSARGVRRRRGRRRRRGEGRERTAWRAPCAFLDIAESAEGPVGLLDVDLPVRKELKDLLAFFARHLEVLAGLVELRSHVVDAHLASGESLEEIADLRRRGRRHG